MWFQCGNWSHNRVLGLVWHSWKQLSFWKKEMVAILEVISASDRGYMKKSTKCKCFVDEYSGKRVPCPQCWANGYRPYGEFLIGNTDILEFKYKNGKRNTLRRSLYAVIKKSIKKMKGMSILIYDK
jgi:hypothetical protein